MPRHLINSDDVSLAALDTTPRKVVVGGFPFHSLEKDFNASQIIFFPLIFLGQFSSPSSPNPNPNLLPPPPRHQDGILNSHAEGNIAKSPLDGKDSHLSYPWILRTLQALGPSHRADNKRFALFHR